MKIMKRIFYILVLIFLSSCNTFWYTANFTNYFYQDHYLQPATSTVMVYEDFANNQFHYDWGRPSWDIWGGTIFKDSQVKIENNTLVLTTAQNNVQGEPGVMSGEITSSTFLNQTYGFYEVCMRPCGEWDAIWNWLSDNLPADVKKYEIDIMEMMGGTNEFSSTIHDHGYDGKTPNKALGSKNWKFKKPLTDNYHVWGMDWRETYIDFYLDGKLLWHYTGTIPNTNCFFWINNNYKGGQLPVSNHIKQIRIQY